MSTYPVLNDRPIDQWTVSELEDELEQRNLPVSGLKDDLLKRLFEAMQDEVLDGGGKATGVTSPPEELKGGEFPGYIDASVNQASIEQHVDKGASAVAKQGADLVLSVTEAHDGSTFATSEVTQEAVVGTAEASQRSLDAVAEVDSSLVDTAATDETNGNGLDSASSGNTIVKEANPHFEAHGDTTEKTPEDDTNKKMAGDDEPSDHTGGDIKLGLDVHSKILKLEDEPAPPDDMKLHSDHEDSDAVAVAEPEDDTSKKMIIDDVPYALTHTNVELGAKVDCEIEQEVSTLSDATALHAYPKEPIVAAAEGLVVGTAEATQRGLNAVAEVESSLVDTAATNEINGNGIDSASSVNTIVKETNPYSEGHGDTIEKTPEDETNKRMAVHDQPSDLTGGDIKLSLDVHSKILKLEDKPTSSDGHGDTIEKTPEDETNKKMVVHDEPSDLTGGDIKLGLDVHSKILKLEDKPAPSGDMLHSDHEDSDVVAVAEPEDDTSKKMIIDDVPSGFTHTNVELGAKVGCKIEQEEVSTLFDATGLHAYPKEPIVAAAEGLVVGTAEATQRSLNAVAEVQSSLVDTAATDESNVNGLDSASSVNTIVKEANPHSEGHGDTIEKIPEDETNKKMAVHDEPSDLTGGDIKLGLDVHSKILKLEDKPTPSDDMLHGDHVDSDAVAVAEREDDTSKKMIIDDVPSDLTHTNVELGAKVDCKIEQEQVSTLSDATALHAYPKEHIVAAAKGLAHPSRTPMSGYTSNIDLDRKEESPDRNSHEKLNLDRSSGDESMDEDVMESKHDDSYIKPDDLRGKTEVTSEHVFKEVSLHDTHAEGSSAHSKEVVTEEKPPTPTEKRKPEDREVIENNAPIKRQRLWNKDAVNIPHQKAPKITSTGTQKEVICPAPERSFGRPNTIARRISPKERIVRPAKTAATTSLRIDRFVRPFTLKAVQELLGKTGSVCSFWMDQIKTHCYVTYSSVEEAVATRNAVYNLQWPPNNHNYLIAEFVDPEEVKLKLETPPSQVPINPSTVTAPQAATFQQPEANQTLVPPHAPATSRGLLATPAPFAKLPPASDTGPERESLPPPPPMNLEPARTLDDLFKKTQAYPRIYYMPLTEEEVSAKRAAHDNGKRG